MSSIYSRTTNGGTTFDLLCSADSVPNYACDAVVDLRREHGLARAKEKLTNLVRDNISSLEIGTDKQVKKFYIGKTYVQSNKRRQRVERFDPMDCKTWRKKGISSRWGKHKHKPYGRDGLVVLGVVNKDAIPRRCRVDQELYALALEQQLLHHFMIEDPDDRIANETFSTGQTEKKKSIGHAVYMAYALAPSGRPEPGEPSSRTRTGVQFREPLETVHHLVDDMQNGGVPSQNHGDDTAGNPSDLGSLSSSTQAELTLQQWARAHAHQLAQFASASTAMRDAHAQAGLQTTIPGASRADGTPVGKAHHSEATNSTSPTTTVTEKRLVNNTVTSTFATTIPAPSHTTSTQAYAEGTESSSSNNNPSYGAHGGLEPGNHHDGSPAPVAFNIRRIMTCPGSRCRNKSTTRPRFNCPSCNQCYHKQCLVEMTVTPEATYMFQCGFEVAKCEVARGRGDSWVQCITCKKTFHKNCVKELL